MLCVQFCTAVAAHNDCVSVYTCSRPLLLIIQNLSTQQTQNICVAFVQHRPNVFDVGPKLYKCYTNVLYLLATGSLLGHPFNSASIVSCQNTYPLIKVYSMTLKSI